MVLEETVKFVEELFKRLDEDISKFQEASGLHCKWGCGACCLKPDIEATTLEFLPFAYHLYKEGTLEKWHGDLGQRESPICAILHPAQGGAGLCSSYPQRGLICRLFGYSARLNKYGKKELITCAIIKSEQQAGYDKTIASLDGGMEIPVMSQYYFQLHAIDPDLARDRYPVNNAIRKAIEHVMHAVAYRE